MRRTIIAATVAGLVAVGAGSALAAQGQGGQPTNKVNGGGQVLNPGCDSSSTTDDVFQTIAFTALQYGADNTAGNARGQLQWNPHGGSGPSKFHGVVTCLQVDAASGSTPATARVGGYNRDDNTKWRMVVTDAGTGVQGSDMIMLQYNGNNADSCDSQNGDANGSFTLGHGNVTIHKAKS